MKIKRYPGKAVDASLSLDQTNAMELLYEANWLQAHETMKTALGRGTKMRIDNDRISNLSKYQVTLEQLHDLEVDPIDRGVVNTIKELNGYRTTAVRKKQSRKYYPDWDDFREEMYDKRKENHYVLDPTEKKQFRPRQQVPEESFQLPPIPDFTQKNLKRSQTVSYRPSNTVIDIKDLKEMWRTEPPSRQMRMPPPPPPPVPNTCDNETTQQRTLLKNALAKPVNRAKSVRIGSVTTISEDHPPPKPPPRRTVPVINESSASPTLEFEQRERRKPGSSSSSNSDDQFSIPRPRLIVPVHTYARKRRTGNLLNGSESVETPPPPPSPKKTVKTGVNGKGPVKGKGL